MNFAEYACSYGNSKFSILRNYHKKTDFRIV
jgi:hypothetical protein